MNFIIQLVIAIALAIIFKPKIESPDPPSGEDIEFPTVDETRNIQVIFGTVLLKGVACVWGGRDFRYVEQKESGGLLGPDITLGYEYFISFAIAISFGRVGLKRIFLNEALAFDSGTLGQSGVRAIYSDTAFPVNIFQPELFRSEGSQMPRDGFVGTSDFYSGSLDQEINTFIEDQEGSGNVPAYKNLSYMVFKAPYIGNSRTVPTPDIEVERLPKNITSGDDYFIETKPNVYECNPVEILYDIMTNNDYYGIGIPPEKIDEDNFREVGVQLKQEGFGLSLIFEGGSTFEDVKKDIEKHISCNIYLSYITGKWTIKLNRQDYDVNTLKIFDSSNIKNVQKLTKTELPNLASELKISYTDRESEYKKRTITASSPTIERLRGAPKVENDEFLACKDRDLASKIVSREIRAYSTPLISLNLLVDRNAFGLQIGDVVIVNYPRYNINNTVFRITEVDLGLFNKREIKLSLIQDIFSFGEEIYSINEDLLNQRPTDTDYIFTNFNFEAPVFFGENHTMITCLEDHNTRSFGFQLYVEESTERLLRASNDSVTTYGILDSQIEVNDTELYIRDSEASRNFNINFIQDATIEQRNQGKNFAILTNGTDQELISFRRATLDGSNSRYILEDVWRGGLDTTPKFWPSTTKIYFLDYGGLSAILDETKIDGTIKTYDIERRFYTKDNELFVDNATIEFTRRFDKPLYPYALDVNSFRWGTNQTIDNFITYTIVPLNTNLILEWDNADRSDSILKFNYYNRPTDNNEANTIYNLRIYDDTDTLIKNEIGLTSQNYTFTDETTINPLGVHYDKLRFELESERDGILSKEMYNVRIIRE